MIVPMYERRTNRKSGRTRIGGVGITHVRLFGASITCPSSRRRHPAPPPGPMTSPTPSPTTPTGGVCRRVQRRRDRLRRLRRGRPDGAVRGQPGHGDAEREALIDEHLVDAGGCEDDLMEYLNEEHFIHHGQHPTKYVTPDPYRWSDLVIGEGIYFLLANLDRRSTPPSVALSTPGAPIPAALPVTASSIASARALHVRGPLRHLLQAQDGAPSSRDQIRQGRGLPARHVHKQLEKIHEQHGGRRLRAVLDRPR